jgi:hypothetical protein
MTQAGLISTRCSRFVCTSRLSILVGLGLLFFLAPPVGAATLTWSGGGDGHSWDGAGNWTGGTRPGLNDVLHITAPVTIDNVYRDAVANLYADGSTWQGTVNLNQGTIAIGARFETGSNGAFNIGDGNGAADAVVTVGDGAWWMFDRHNNGIFTVNIKSDGQLNTAGSGDLRSFNGLLNRRWVINVQGGSITSANAWNMSDGAGNDANLLNLSNGGTVTVGPVTVHEELIDFADSTACSFTADFGGSFPNITTVEAALGTRFTSSGGVKLEATDNGSSFTVARARVNNGAGASDLTMTSATLNGELNAVDGLTHVWVYWGANDAMTLKWAWAETEYLGVRAVGSLSTNITGLFADKTYHYRFYASNATWDAWAPETAVFRTQTAFTWDGDADDAWGNAANWVGGNVPDAGGEYAAFGGMGVGDVDLNGAGYAVDFVSFTAGDYRLIDSGAGSLTAGALTSSAGSNAISANVTVTGVTDVSGSTLTLDPVDRFRAGGITLGGATLVVDGATTTTSVLMNVLLHKGYDGANSDAHLDLGDNGGLMAMVPYGKAMLTDGPGDRGLDSHSALLLTHFRRFSSTVVRSQT